MKNIFQKNFSFLLPYIVFLLAGGTVISVFSKAEIHLFINQFHNDFGNYFFSYITYLGDGIAVIAIIFLLCFVRYRFALLTAASNIFSSVLVQILKRTIFSEVDRPTEFFKGIHNLNLVPWVDNLVYNSFPSGHTTAAFTTFFCIALCAEKKWIKFFCFIVALTIAFSRVYLSQHFFNDIYAGSIIGVVISLLIYKYVFLSKKISGIKWMEKSFLNR